MTPAAEASPVPPERGVLAQIAISITRDRVSLFFLLVLVAIVLVAIFADRIAPYDPIAQSLSVIPPVPGEHQKTGWRTVAFVSTIAMVT